MAIPALTEVESSRIKAWAYEPSTNRLYVRFPGSKKKPAGVIGFYRFIAPEQWDEAQEAVSKGKWLIAEVINRPNSHPWTALEDTEPSAQVEDSPKEDPTPDPNLIPEPIRAIATLPNTPIITLPEILPPNAKEGEEKPFNQVVMERAMAIAAALPSSLTISSAEAYKALGTALVGIRTERIAVEKALDTIIQPAIDWKRNYDNWRGIVLEKFRAAEKSLDTALQNFKRAEDTRIREEESRLRKQAAEEANRKARVAEEAERQRNREEAEKLENEAKARLAEATTALHAAEAEKSSTPSPDSLFGSTGASLAASIVSDAHEEIRMANADLETAAALASAPITKRDVYVPPVVMEKTDLKVPGLRKKSPLWRWRLKPDMANKPLEADVPISRLDLRNPDAFPAEYWILDQKAISAVVTGMKGRTSIEAIETYDENA